VVDSWNNLLHQGCRQIRLTIRYINQINQFKYDVYPLDCVKAPSGYYRDG
jgi:hypothetical protein